MTETIDRARTLIESRLSELSSRRISLALEH
jgi:hypothetical protein